MRVKSLDFMGYGNYEVSSYGSVYSHNKGDYLVPQKNTQGYLQVSLCSEGECKTFTIHRLVAKAFNGETYKVGHHCHHRDGNIHNNNIENLEWLSPKDHILEGWKLGQYKCKYTEKILTRINNLLIKGFSDFQVSESTGAPLYVVQEFRTGKMQTSSTEDVKGREVNRVKNRCTEDEAYNIISHLNSGLEDFKISNLVGVGRKTVNRIRRGESFKHLNHLISETKTGQKVKGRLQKEDIKSILDLQKQGNGVKQISDLLGISKDKVKSVLSGKCYKDFIREIKEKNNVCYCKER